MLKVRDYAQVFMTCIAGIFGVRTPPEPEVIPHMVPVTGPEGSDPDRADEAPQGHAVLMPPRQTSAPNGAGYTLDLPAGLDVAFRPEAPVQFGSPSGQEPPP